MSRRIVLAGLLAVLAGAAPGAVLAARLWDVQANPTTLTAGATTAVRITVTNTGSSKGGDEITCVRIQVPSGFAISSVGVVSVHGQGSGAAAQAWTAVWPGGSTVTFKEPGDSWPLVGSSPPDDEAVFRITGTAANPGLQSWTANAADKPGSAGSLACGAGDDFAQKSLSLTVVAQSTPTPAPTPTPTRTPAPTPTPTPAPTASPTPAPTSTPRPSSGATAPPTASPAPSPRSTPSQPAATPGSTLPTAAPGETAPGSGAPASPLPPGASPTADPALASNSPAGPSPAGSAPSPATSGTLPSGSEPPSTAGGQTGGIHVGGGRTGSDGADALGGLGGAALAALDRLPGGLLSWSYPALVMSVPGLLVLLAIGAQAFGALGWLPIVRRKLGGFGLRRQPERD